MKFALSTNWCCRRIASGEAISELAGSLGFEELELGFGTSAEQAEGIRRRLDEMPVASVHAFCPAPLSAPSAHPELYSLASFDPEERSMAHLQVLRTVRFAADIGARSVVLHAGRVSLKGLFSRLDSARLKHSLQRAGGESIDQRYMKLLSLAKYRREARGRRLLEAFKAELANMVPELEKLGVVLALENLPYFEGFPDEREMGRLLQEFAGAPVAAWFDAGHHHIRRQCGWVGLGQGPVSAFKVRGIHLNDNLGVEDEHLSPGDGKVDFCALAPMAKAAEHLVFEPGPSVDEESVRRGLGYICGLWMNSSSPLA